MFDRETESLWQSLTGEPVMGELAYSGLRLKFLWINFTTWADWLERNPETTVLALDQGTRRQYRHPDDPYAVYSDYFSTPDVWFPPYVRSDELVQKSRVFGIEHGNAATAYPLAILGETDVVNDRVGVLDVVITFDTASSLSRSYLRDGRVFIRGPAPGQLLDDSGVLWNETETGLVAADNSGEDSGRVLERVNGIESYWFGWFALRPHTRIYTTQ